MLHEVMDYYGVHRDFRHAGYFATEAQQQLSTALKAAIKQGQLIAVAGIVGSGKTTLLHRVQDELMREKAHSIAFSGNVLSPLRLSCDFHVLPPSSLIS